MRFHKKKQRPFFKMTLEHSSHFGQVPAFRREILFLSDSNKYKIIYKKETQIRQSEHNENSVFQIDQHRTGDEFFCDCFQHGVTLVCRESQKKCSGYHKANDLVAIFGTGVNRE